MKGLRMGTAGRQWVRDPAVAGQFYAGRPDRLRHEVADHLAAATRAMSDSARTAERRPDHGRLVAVVAPHAGHVYSGPTAGYAYAALDPAEVRRVVLLGPAHYVAIDGIGLSTARAWRTPLGDVPIDAEVGADLREQFAHVGPGDAAHAPEHSLEVQLPFLQQVLDEGWSLVPLIVGSDLPDELAALIGRCVALPNTLVVVSTDLSHYLDHETAVARDARTIEAVLARAPERIGAYDACGRNPLRGLLTAASASGWHMQLLDARNSGDTAGGWDRVVGYAAFAVRAEPLPRSDDATGSIAPNSPAGLAVSGGAASAAAGSDAAGPHGAASGDAVPPDAEAGEARSAKPHGTAADALSPDERSALLRLARSTIEEALRTGRRPRITAHDWPERLRRLGAAFVTLRSATGELLGCIGSLTAYQPLVADVATHAYDAAFRDPRFPAMTPRRAAGMVVDVSVLSPPEPFPCAGYQELLERVPVGSGVVVSAGPHRATFLPAVWAELPDAATFLAALWRKAGLRPGDWPAGTFIEVYGSQEFAET